MNDGSIKNIVIVGGGSAGWIVAGVLAGERAGTARSEFTVTLVESPDVKTIGVGEGTWPTMRATLQKIGISETQFLKECAASFKQGTKFAGWVTGEDDDSYYHPFTAPAGYTNFDLVPHWLPEKKRVSFANAVTVQGYLCDRNLAPKQQTTPEYAAIANYAYHLDAGKFAELLQRHCTGRLGVRHVLDHVTSVNGAPDENIRSIETANSGTLEGDLFIDCSGFQALLLNKHYGVPYLDRNDVLFNDAALALQVPYSDPREPIASQTISTAQSAGWIWDIGLTTRRGIGYTYSSRHLDDDRAALELQSYVARTAGAESAKLEPRKISFRPGHRETFWHRNCVAVGMSAGFLEPLEASALVLVELSAKMISEELPANAALMPLVAKRYNERFRYRWDRIIDFLKLHYVLSRRSDSPFWTDNRENGSIPESLQEMLSLWRYRVPLHSDLPRMDEIFSAASYQYVLYGMGFETELTAGARGPNTSDRAKRLFVENVKKANQFIAQLPSNRELLNEVGQHGMPVAQAG